LEDVVQAENNQQTRGEAEKRREKLIEKASKPQALAWG